MLQQILEQINFNEIISLVIIAFLGVAFKWFKKYAIPWIKEKFSDNVISALVLTAEQLYKNGVLASGEEKLAYVLKYAEEKLAAIGITIDTDTITQKVNAFVMDFFNKNTTSSETTTTE